MESGADNVGDAPSWVTGLNAQIEEMEARQREMELARERRRERATRELAAREAAAKASNKESEKSRADHRVNSIAAKMISYCHERIVGKSIPTDSALTVRFRYSTPSSNGERQELLLAPAWQVKPAEHYYTEYRDEDGYPAKARQMVPGLWLDESGNLRMNWNDYELTYPLGWGSERRPARPVVTLDSLYPRVVWGQTGKFQVDPIELTYSWKWQGYERWQRPLPYRQSSPTPPRKGLPYRENGQTHCSQCGQGSPLVYVSPGATTDNPHADLLAYHLILFLRRNNALPNL